jgi:hypothetical protein
LFSGKRLQKESATRAVFPDIEHFCQRLGIQSVRFRQSGQPDGLGD